MRRQGPRIFALALTVALAGCSTDLAPFYEQQNIRERWDAQNVYPQNYKSDLLAFLRTYLNNPENVRDTALAPPQLKQVGPGQRYVACVRYNAREAHGKYAGVKTGAAVYVSGKLDNFLDGKQAQPYCTDAAYAPFPELAHLTR